MRGYSRLRKIDIRRIRSLDGKWFACGDFFGTGECVVRLMDHIKTPADFKTLSEYKESIMKKWGRATIPLNLKMCHGSGYLERIKAESDDSRRMVFFLNNHIFIQHRFVTFVNDAYSDMGSVSWTCSRLTKDGGGAPMPIIARVKRKVVAYVMPGCMGEDRKLDAG